MDCAREVYRGTETGPATLAFGYGSRTVCNETSSPHASVP